MGKSCYVQQCRLRCEFCKNRKWTNTYCMYTKPCSGQRIGWQMYGSVGTNRTMSAFSSFSSLPVGGLNNPRTIVLLVIGYNTVMSTDMTAVSNVFLSWFTIGGTENSRTKIEEKLQQSWLQPAPHSEQMLTDFLPARGSDITASNFSSGSILHYMNNSIK